MINVRIKRLSDGAVIPTKANEYDAGWDFYAPADMNPVTIYPHERRIIKIGISIAIPVGWYLQVASRSGLACNGIDARAGVIDCMYRGEIGIILHNDTEFDEYTINHGDKIAQGVFLPVPSVNWDEVDELDETMRGEGGFGSSGR